jgi:hypothetical protein
MEIEQILHALPAIEQQPVPYVVATALTNDGVTLEARFWLRAASPDAAQRVGEVIEALRPVVEQAKQQATQEVAPAS